MISFKQFLNEWSWTSKGVDNYMLDQGYTKLGKGVDQTAWHKDGEDTIVKIFGTKRSLYDKHPEAHMMFKFFAEYCDKTPDNQFLPKFYGWEAFEWDNQKYLQIRMEMLTKLSPALGESLENAVAGRAGGRYPTLRQKEKVRLMNLEPTPYNTHYSSTRRANREIDGTAQLAMLIGEEGLNQLFDTIAELGDIGRKHMWGIDLHRGNFMMRSDGTPVIVDPWVV